MLWLNVNRSNDVINNFTALSKFELTQTHTHTCVECYRIFPWSIFIVVLYGMVYYTHRSNRILSLNQYLHLFPVRKHTIYKYIYIF